MTTREMGLFKSRAPQPVVREVAELQAARGEVVREVLEIVLKHYKNASKGRPDIALNQIRDDIVLLHSRLMVEGKI